MPSKYQKVKDGIFYNHKFGRIMNHQGYSTSIHWNEDMLYYLRTNYATMLNEELAGCIGVSMRTMIRKARQLGLEKDKDWLTRIWNERRKVAHAVSKAKGCPGGFKKGERAYPEGEFKKGRKPSEEELAKRSESMRRWYSLYPHKAKAKALKAWETRRKRMAEYAES